jgi:hypothetical protein
MNLDVQRVRRQRLHLFQPRPIHHVLRSFAHPNAPHCSILFSQTDRPSIAPFDDLGYPFLSVLSANRMKLGPGWRFPGARNKPHSFHW